MCSSTLLYLLFTESIHTVHPQISMIQLVAPSQTASEMLDGQRERETERETEREVEGAGRPKKGVGVLFKEEATEKPT